MRILFVSDFVYNPNTGAAGSLITIGTHLEKQGCEVEYIWHKKRKYVKGTNYGRFLELPMVQYRQVKKALEQRQFDVVIISQPHAWYAVKKLKPLYPNVVFVNRTHGWELRLAEGKYKFSLKTLLPGFKKLTVVSFLKHCSKLTVKHSDAVFCAGSDDANYIRKAYPRYAGKVYSISYGLESSYIGIPLQTQSNPKIKFLFAGQYQIRKGIKDIQQVFRQLSGRANAFQLTFIVHQNSVAQVQEDFGFLTADTLKVSGWVGREELKDIYLQNDVFLMPSYGEGFGKSTLEAMACGLCVIGYKEGAINDLGRHKENVLASELGDVQGLLQNITYALDRPEVIKTYGLQAYHDVQGQTWERHAAETKEILTGLQKAVR